MTRLPLIALISCAAVMLGCSHSTAPEAPKQCQVEDLQHLIGQTLTAELAEQAQSQANATWLRVIGPNQAVTLDYNPERLNIHHDEDDQILRLSCG